MVMVNNNKNNNNRLTWFPCYLNESYVELKKIRLFVDDDRRIHKKAFSIAITVMRHRKKFCLYINVNVNTSPRASDNVRSTGVRFDKFSQTAWSTREAIKRVVGKFACLAKVANRVPMVVLRKKNSVI